MNDTITAISTSIGAGAIAIIRISGKEAISIVNKIFKGKDLTKVESHTINYGYIIENNKVIDEVLVSIMKAPKTFTMEDVVEINCHGSIAALNKILEMLLLKGCRLAEPGEFTKRAFLNGRIDLIKAESVMDVINSKTEKSLTLAVNQLTGDVSNLINIQRNKILNILANINVKIDYPEYEDIEDITHEQLLKEITEINVDLNKILKNSENGKIIKEGIKTSIIGKPNVGKSSLLNKLIDEDKAIVTDVAGTTRDIVEGTLKIDGIIINLIDTAGIRDTEDIVENIGVKKSLSLIEKSDLILFMLDNNKPLDKFDYEIMSKLKNKKFIIIINKIELESKININEIPSDNLIEMSILNNKGIEELKEKIKELYNMEELDELDLTYLTSARSIALLKQSLSLIPQIISTIKSNVPIDMVEIDIKKLWTILGEITGETYQDELINQLFTQFCLGK